MTPSTRYYYYDLATDTTLDIPIPTITSCSGVEYTFNMTAPTFTNGGSLISQFAYSSTPTPKITVTMGPTNNALAGAYVIRLTYYSNGLYLNEMISIVIKPVTTLNPNTPNHTISQCTRKIYPFTYGHE